MEQTRFVELRQYTLFGGRRNELVELFEREFVETQEAAGIQVFGRFVDLDDPDRFVWMRGFSDLAARGRALAGFYGGPVWAAHGQAANATMLDSDNVLLLQPLNGVDRVRQDLTVTTGLLRVTIHSLNGVPPETFATFWTEELRPMLVDSGCSPFRPLMTAPVENNFPRLPVRNDPAFLWFMTFADAEEERDFSAWWACRSGWRDRIARDLTPALMRKPEVLRLSPVRR